MEDAPGVIAELKAMTRDYGRDPEALRIVKIVYSNAPLDDLKRYRDAGVTDFNIASSGEIRRCTRHPRQACRMAGAAGRSDRKPLVQL